MIEANTRYFLIILFYHNLNIVLHIKYLVDAHRQWIHLFDTFDSFFDLDLVKAEFLDQLKMVEAELRIL